MKVGIKQISEIAGVSASTVSNVINGKKGVNADTAMRVLQIAKEVGYFTSAHISKIKLVMYQKTGRILTETPLITALLDGIITESRAHGYETLICKIKESDPDFSSQLFSLFSERSCAVLLLATEMTAEDIRLFHQIQTPLVVVDAWFRDENFDTVLMNNYDSALRSVQYLIDQGHRRIGCLNSAIDIQNFRERRRGMMDALSERGIEFNDAYCVLLDPTSNGAYEDMKAYLKTSPELPTAYYADNDIIAIGAMKALLEHGVAVPRDVSIIGFDNMPFSEISSPGLTTVDVPKYELGVVAARRLIEQIEQRSTGPARVELLTKLIVRGSVCKIP